MEVPYKADYQAGKVYMFSMFKKIWLIWCRTVDHRIGKTDRDEPDIPILTLKVFGTNNDILLFSVNNPNELGKLPTIILLSFFSVSIFFIITGIISYFI